MSRQPSGSFPVLPLAEASLFLDLDGTIAPLCVTPDAVAPDPARTQLLRRLQEQLRGRLAIVSGRTIASVDAILEGACRAVAGVHGLQRRSALGLLESENVCPRVARAAAEMALFARHCPGLLVEEKGVSAALHYRGAPKAAAAVMEFAARIAQAETLEIQPGNMVVELRLPGPDKGAAVRAFMNELPFRGTTPVYVGDDLTDEAGFAAAAALGGRGVLVAAHRQSAARAWIEDSGAVLRWLADSLLLEAFVFRRARPLAA